MPNIRTHFAYPDFPIDRCSVGSFADHLVDKRGGLKWLADESDNVLWTARTITHAKNELVSRRPRRESSGVHRIIKRENSTFLHFYILHLLDLHTSLNSFAGLWLHKQLIGRSKFELDVMKYSCNLRAMHAERGIAELGNSKERWGKDYISSCRGRKQIKGEKDRINAKATQLRCYLHPRARWQRWMSQVTTGHFSLVCMNSSCQCLNSGRRWCWSNLVLHLLINTVSEH